MTPEKLATIEEALMRDSFENEPAVKEARSYADRALGQIKSLHLGPLDYNVATACDYLRTAAAILEEFGRRAG
jgi:hypothetical protein